jgi:Na+-transporting methylmalonyl-CoA/oxaloacetate decarboxylase gamma subunit
MRATTANGTEPPTLGQFASTRVVPRTCALLQVVVVFALSGAVTRNTPQETNRTSPHESISVQVHSQEQRQRKVMPASIHMHRQRHCAAPHVRAESRIPGEDVPTCSTAPPSLEATQGCRCPGLQGCVLCLHRVLPPGMPFRCCLHCAGLQRLQTGRQARKRTG